MKEMGISGPTVNGHTYQGIQLVTHEDGNAGFCALITYALNGIRRALELDRLPVVLFDASNNRRFYDPERGPNVWEYFFEPVMGMSHAECQEHQATAGWQVSRFTFDQILGHHLHDPDRVATFWSYDEPEDPAAWMAEKRALGRDMLSRFVRVRIGIQEKAQAFFNEHLHGSYTVGVHIRGTDYAYADPIPPEAYYAGIRSHVRAIGLDSFKVFLATDQQQFVDGFRTEFGDRLVVSDCLRSETSVAPFNLNEGRSPYLLGEEVLLDVLALSRTDYLFKGPSAVGEYAMWFGPQLECTDFAVSSRFRPRAVDLMAPAFTSLNVAGRRGPRLWLNQMWISTAWLRSVVLLGSRLRRRLSWLVRRRS